MGNLPLSLTKYNPDALSLTDKQEAWLGAYTDAENPKTFRNHMESARVAYDTDNTKTCYRLGLDNKIKFKSLLLRWMEGESLGEYALKSKLAQLLHQKQTKFFAHQGKIVSREIVEMPDIQLKALDMALKVSGFYEKDNSQKSKVDLNDLLGVIDRINPLLGNRVRQELAKSLS